MDKTKINRQLGTKWFTFYTKVRPWITCFFSIAIFVDFFQYTDLYFYFWWMLLYFMASIAQVVLSVIVFFKSKGDYGKFVHLAKGVLIFETINMAYQQGVQEYLNYFEIETAILIALIVFIAGYFFWYRLNIKYFKKRLLKESTELTDYNFESVHSPSSNYNSNKFKKTYDNVYGNDIKLQPNDDESDGISEQTLKLNRVNEIIDILWEKDGVKEVIAECKKIINHFIKEDKVTRKTDLLLRGTEITIEQLINILKKPQTNMGTKTITAFIYYRFFFESVLSLDTDIFSISKYYTLFKITKYIPTDMHPYVQIMIKIYDLLDRGIIYLYENIDSVSKDYFSIVALKIRNMLETYEDDTTDWNKINSINL